MSEQKDNTPIREYVGWTLVDVDAAQPVFHGDGPIPNPGDTVILSEDGGFMVLHRIYCLNLDGDLVVQVQGKFTAAGLFESAYAAALSEASVGGES